MATTRARTPKAKAKATPPKHMTSQALAVKYRPKTFRDLVGQNDVVTVLRGAFKSGKIPSSILLEGATGSGKTTCARLICMYLNCETGRACGKCDSCKYILAGAHPDVVEKDMGTNNKVDDARALVKSAQAAPILGRKRIFILEECHGMTKDAARALLRTLEEPPANTVFLLATTNPEKLLPTILNRVLRLTLKTIDKDAIVTHLLKVAEQEGYDLRKQAGAKSALNMIADFSGGHMRDALALLEYVLYAIEGGADLSNKTVLEQFLSNSEVDMDKLSASLVCATLNSDLENAIKYLQLCTNPRGLISKCRWLLDYIIRDATGTVKYAPYNGKLFMKTAKQKGIEYSLPELLRMQNMIVDAELLFNTTAIDESVLFQSRLGVFMAEEYERTQTK